MKLIHALGAAALATACTGFAAAQDQAATNRNATRNAASTSPAAAASSESYVHDTAMTGMFEIQAGKLASEKSKNAGVKTFADHMVKDHTALDDKLKKTLDDADTGITPPADLDSTHAQMLSQLKDAPDADFNKTYMDMQVKGHRQALTLQQNYAAKGDNAKLKSFASSAVPTIKEHLAEAQRIDRSLASTASYGGNAKD